MAVAEELHLPDSMPASVARAMQLPGANAPLVQISLETGGPCA